MKNAIQTNASQVPADERFRAALASPIIKQQFEAALKKNASVFTASLLDIYVSELFQYPPMDVIGEAMKAATLNLPITKSLGFAYIVPYKGRVQFQIGYKGMIQLAMRSGQVRTINAGPVYEGEWVSTDKLRGLYDLSGERKSDVVIGYFAYLQLINGFEKTIYWTEEHVIKHAEKKSPSYKNKKSAWFTDFDAMATKTTIRALFGKYAPMSVDFQRALTLDEPEEKSVDLEAESKPLQTEAESGDEYAIDADEMADEFGDEPDFGD